MAKKSYNITFIITLFFLLVSIDNTPNAASISKTNEFPGLYTLNDNLEIFTNTNIDKKLYGKKHAWLIEFYSSWCGHCQKFAPHWKSFATDILDWTNSVKVGAIDCSQEENTPVCRQFEIMGYPTVRYFHENFEAGPTNIGQPMKTAGDTDVLRHNLIEILKSEQSKGDLKNVPSLLPYEGNDISGLWENAGTKSFMFVIVETSNSSLSAEVILDYTYANDIVIECVKSTQTSLLTQLNVVQIPSLSVILKDLSIIPITPRNKSRTTFKNAIKVFLESKDYQLPKSETHSFNEDLKKAIVDDDFNYLTDHLSHMGDVLFQVDLENTLHYSLKHEISAMKLIDGPRYKALIDFFNVLIKYFPFGDNGIKFLKALKHRIEQTENSISGEAIANHIHDLEKLYEPVYSLPLQWLGCRGSTASRRGYPCGLWKLFHFLTVRSSEVALSNEHNNEVLSVMHGYIKNFFGCTHCSQHFQEMAQQRKLFDVSSPNESVLWLWESHNVVNKRLAGDVTEDPSYPKVEFPKPDNCNSCRNMDGSWNRDEVLRYMKKVYSVQNIQKHMPESSDNNLTSASRASRISSFDVSLYLLLYICSAGMLVLIIRLFLRKGYRKKAYVHDILGKV